MTGLEDAPEDHRLVGAVSAAAQLHGLLGAAGRRAGVQSAAWAGIRHTVPERGPVGLLGHKDFGPYQTEGMLPA